VGMAVVVVVISLLAMGVAVVLAVVMAIMLVMLGLFVMVRVGGDRLGAGHGGCGRRTAAKNADRQHAEENSKKAPVTGNQRTHHASPDRVFFGWATGIRPIIPIMSAER